MICWKTFLASGSELFPFLTEGEREREREGGREGGREGLDKEDCVNGSKYRGSKKENTETSSTEYIHNSNNT